MIDSDRIRLAKCKGVRVSGRQGGRSVFSLLSVTLRGNFLYPCLA